MNIFLQKNLAEMKVIHYGFALSYIYMGRGTQIPVAVTFLKEALRSSSEKTCLGAMIQSNLNKNSLCLDFILHLPYMVYL